MNTQARERTTYIRFSMRVPDTLLDKFREACGLAPMTAVTKKLWLEFIATHALKNKEKQSGQDRSS